MDFLNSKIQVAIRMRPLLPQEQEHTSTRAKVDQDSIVISSSDERHSKRFKFDKVFHESSPQSEIFECCQVSSLVQKVVEGYNATVFAYGQTGSGKTYTMEGFEYKNKRPIIREDESVGLIPRAVQALFEYISDKEFTVYCSYVQLYNEKIYDLLNLRKKDLKLRWNKEEEFHLENLFLHPCYTAQEVMSHFYAGLKNKVIASHKLNSASSRSHCILTLHVESMNGDSVLSSKLNLVDLAGSERVSFTGNEGTQLKESVDINKALFTLRQVITALSVKDGSYVPYRDSKLTSMLKQGIGGNSYCLMIACISPSDLFFEENLSTLMYATKAGRISNEPVKNVDAKSKVIESLTKENKNLKKELETAHTQISMLTDLLQLEKNDQVSRLKDMENMPFKTQHIERFRALRSSLESRSKSQHKSGENRVPHEVMSEKLHESVRMIRDLMESNRHMKETISQLQITKRQQTNHINLLENEKQRLNDQHASRKTDKKPPSSFKMNEHNLEQRMNQIDHEDFQMNLVFPKEAWGSEPRNSTHGPFLPAIPNHSVEDVSKKDAISALSKMILNRVKNKR